MRGMGGCVAETARGLVQTGHRHGGATGACQHRPLFHKAVSQSSLAVPMAGFRRPYEDH